VTGISRINERSPGIYRTPAFVFAAAAPSVTVPSVLCAACDKSAYTYSYHGYKRSARCRSVLPRLRKVDHPLARNRRRGCTHPMRRWASRAGESVLRNVLRLCVL
jgi:hypothetical protein